MLWMLLLAVATAQPPSHPAVAHAEGWLGTAYRWNGRGTRSLPGLDCLGLLYRAWGPVTGTAWRQYPVDPTPLVASGLLGAPVVGLAGVRRGNVDASELEAGDVLYLLMAERPIPDAPLWIELRPCEQGRCTVSYWPWHTVLYAGEGEVLHAAPGDVVRRQAMDELAWDALYVTRR